MRFNTALDLLTSGVPIVNSVHGRLFPLHPKESIFAKVSITAAKKFFIGNQHLNFAVNLLPNDANAQLVYLANYINTEGWEIYKHQGEEKC